MECVHLKEQPDYGSTLPGYMHCIQWDPRISYFWIIWQESQVVFVQGYLKWPRCRYLNVLERNGKYPLQISLLEVCLPRGVLGLWLATFREVRGAELARLSPRVEGGLTDCNPWMSKMPLSCFQRGSNVSMLYISAVITCSLAMGCMIYDIAEVGRN
jgi:hypothetical protein